MKKVNTEDKSRDMNNHFQRKSLQAMATSSSGDGGGGGGCIRTCVEIAIARKISTKNFFNTNKSF